MTSNPVDASLPVRAVATADQPGTTRGTETGQQRVGAAEREAQFAARLLRADLAAVSPVKDVDTAIQLGVLPAQALQFLELLAPSASSASVPASQFFDLVYVFAVT